VKVSKYNFEIVEDCTQLATILSNKNELRPEIEKKKELRIQIEHIMYFCIYKTANQYSEQQKIKIYKTFNKISGNILSRILKLE
jgi:hypothetical protein